VTADLATFPTPYQLLPRLTEDEFTSLKADIATNGIRVPIDVDEAGTIIDGHHRAWIAADLGVDCPRRVVAGLTDEQKRAHAIATNVYRRNLSRDQRREMVARLRADGMSLRTIAGHAQVDESTVRDDLRSDMRGDPAPRIVNGSDGKTYSPKTVVEERRRNVAELIDAGLNQKQIAEALSTPRSTISDDVKALDLPVEPAFTKSPSDTPRKIERIREMAERGHSSHQIARGLGIAPERVRHHARENDIEIRADKVTRSIDSNRIASEIVAALEGFTTVLRLINYDDLDAAETANWANSLTESIRPLNRFIKQIRELA
jgi:DNA-binding NarL/FixJ family response regulator